MAASIFQDRTAKVPSNDGQIIRVNMEDQEIGGRKSHLPSESRSPSMGIDHVPNSGTKS